MLVLSRKRNEEIVLRVKGEVVATITVVDIRGDKTRIGVESGDEVIIHRKEVDDAVQRGEKQNKHAS